MTHPFYFLRHGQTDWNLAGRLQGHTDIHLNETGHAQARAAAAILKAHSITQVVSSPLQRALVTATYIAEHCNLPLTADLRLREQFCGPLEGLTKDDMAAKEGELYDPALPLNWAGYKPLYAHHAIESHDAVADRASAAVFNLLDKHPNDTLLLVSHGVWFLALCYRLTGKLFKSENAVPYKLSPDGHSWTIEALA